MSEAGESRPGTPPPVERILQVGTRVFLFVTGERGEQKWPSRLLGWQGGRFLLLRLPRDGVRPLQLPEGSAVVVRYILDGEVYGLRTRVLKVQFQPTDLLFLAFPDEVENVPLRSRSRVAVRLPTVVSWLPGKGAPDGVTFGFLRDLTPDGGLLEVPLADGCQPQGCSLHVTFLLGQDDEVLTHARVRNVDRKGPTWRLGIAFVWREPKDQKRVEVFCRLH